MNLFTEIEGQKGEMLAVSGLRILLTEYSSFRNEFARLLSGKKNPVGILSHEVSFACESEVSTNDEIGGGRVDLVIEADNAVVGIEAKLGATLTAEQPRKYIKTLQSRAQGLGQARGVEHYPCMVVLLVPEWQLRQAKRVQVELKQEGHPAIVISWLEVITAFDKAVADSGRASEQVYIFRQWKDYVDAKTGRIADLELVWKYCLNNFPKRAGPMHRHIVRALWHLFPNGGGRMTTAHDYIGYDFYPCDEDWETYESISCYGWYGFIRRSYLGESIRHGSECAFAIYTDFNPYAEDQRPNYMKQIDVSETLGHSWWTSPGRNSRYMWVLDIEGQEKEWERPEQWQEMLQPFTDYAAA